jgi:hypothetical protein
MNGEDPAPRPLRVAAATLVVSFMLLAPAGARADTAPAITKGPVIAGVPRESETLTASAEWTGDPEPTAAWRWVRCMASATGQCKGIKGAASPEYRVTAADVGSVLRARVKVTNKAGTAEARSGPTSVIEAAPDSTPSPTPTPTPTPTPIPDETPAPPPASTPFDVPANPVFAPPPAAGDPPAAASVPLLQPFPVVRISGWLTPVGARITRLSVRSPRGSLIAARCRGRSCPVRHVARSAALTRLRPLERRLRAGTRLDITVRKVGYVGKWTTIVIRRGRPPRRADRCVYPERGRPASCPAG